MKGRIGGALRIVGTGEMDENRGHYPAQKSANDIIRSNLPLNVGIGLKLISYKKGAAMNS